MKKTPVKKKPLVEKIKSKKVDQKSGATTEGFRKFQPSKGRNVNTSNVGPSWGGRKGN